MGFRNNIRLLEKAKKLTPVGAQTYSKSYRYFCQGVSPAFLERGKGCYVWDVDGNRYIDFICALGAVTIGYNDSRVNKAIKKQLKKGISFSLATKLEVELCEKLIDIIPCAEMVRLVKNGSDATSAAIRIARAYTGRSLVAVCGYHGMQDWYIGSTENNKGVPEEVCTFTKKFKYNDIASLKRLFDENPDKVAAVILEPIQGNGPENNFLQEVKNVTAKNGAVLIFDEVISGFRYALGGASELYNVIPDMAAIGKGMANGMPISAVVGRKELIEMIETETVFISTTFGGETLSIAAALKSIEIFEKNFFYTKIWELGEYMLEGLRNQIAYFGLEKIIQITGLPPHGGVEFLGYGSLDYLDMHSLYQQRMIKENILTIGINNISFSHYYRQVKKFLEASYKAMEDIKEAIKRDSVNELLKGEKVNPIFRRNISGGRK